MRNLLKLISRNFIALSTAALLLAGTWVVPARASVFINFFGTQSGIMDGAPSPGMLTGTYLRGQHLIGNNSAITLVAAKYYFTPIYLTDGTTFAGAAFYNSGTGDNGKKVKIALYAQAAGGGPGAIAKDFGEVTLSGVSAARQLASSYTVSGTGWYYLALASDTTPALYGAAPGGVTAAGAASLAGRLPTDLAALGGANFVTGYSVAGTYANFPESTALTPTSVITTQMAIGTSLPDFGLYK